MWAVCRPTNGQLLAVSRLSVGQLSVDCSSEGGMMGTSVFPGRGASDVAGREPEHDDVTTYDKLIYYRINYVKAKTDKNDNDCLRYITQRQSNWGQKVGQSLPAL